MSRHSAENPSLQNGQTASDSPTEKAPVKGSPAAAASTGSEQRLFSSPVLGLIWFGASVSLAEILTGTFFAPLGLARGTAAILLGHLIGGLLFFLVALTSARTGDSSMGAAGRAFGRAGKTAFSAANTIQLVGWTAIMVASGAAAAAVLVPQLGKIGWCVLIGALIVVWIAIGSAKMSRVQSVAAALLFVLTIVISIVVFSQGGAASSAPDDTLTFAAAVELAVAMPLSWLPVVGDYTRRAKVPFAGSACATVAYTAGSCWMFFIGLGLAVVAGSSDLAEVLANSGMGLVGILVVVFSTVTTTFLDAESAGISANAMCSRIPAKAAGVVAAIVGTALAICAPVSNFESFLYLLGSIFAPMAAIVVVDVLAYRNDASHTIANWPNVVLWLAGFVLYRISMAWSIPCGNTLPVIAIVAVAAVAVHKATSRAKE